MQTPSFPVWLRNRGGAQRSLSISEAGDPSSLYTSLGQWFLNWLILGIAGEFFSNQMLWGLRSDCGFDGQHTHREVKGVSFQLPASSAPPHRQPLLEFLVCPDQDTHACGFGSFFHNHKCSMLFTFVCPFFSLSTPSWSSFPVST